MMRSRRSKKRLSSRLDPPERISKAPSRYSAGLLALHRCGAEETEGDGPDDNDGVERD